MAEESVDGHKEGSKEVEDEVLHRVAQGVVTAERHIISRDDRTGGACHKLLRVGVHEVIIGIFDNLPTCAEAEREKHQEETEEILVEIDIFVFLRHDDMDKPQGYH